jgi:chemotaxis protein methyltransferase CheR
MQDATLQHAITDDEFEAFRHLIYNESGISLHEGKRALVCSRLSKRLRVLGMHSYLDYYAYLLHSDTDGQEMQQMINCITTNKTEFFREPHHFDFIRNVLVPQAQQRAARGGPRRLRFWSAGCSRGHEPYSLAITILEALGPSRGWDVKILASDIDTEVLETAFQGIYPLDELHGISDELKRKYFLRGTGRRQGDAQARAELKRLITFRRINLTEASWAIQTQFDLILCRNVIIYFNGETQRDLFQRFANFLKPDGHLMLGHSENMPTAQRQFQAIGGTIYRYQPARS